MYVCMYVRTHGSSGCQCRVVCCGLAFSSTVGLAVKCFDDKPSTKHLFFSSSSSSFSLSLSLELSQSLFKGGVFDSTSLRLPVGQAWPTGRKRPHCHSLLLKLVLLLIVIAVDVFFFSSYSSSFPVQMRAYALALPYKYICRPASVGGFVSGAATSTHAFTTCTRGCGPLQRSLTSPSFRCRWWIESRGRGSGCPAGAIMSSEVVFTQTCLGGVSFYWERGEKGRGEAASLMKRELCNHHLVSFFSSSSSSLILLDSIQRSIVRPH